MFTFLTLSDNANHKVAGLLSNAGKQRKSKISVLAREYVLMKCAVIGTSNTIMKGNYLSFFRQISDFDVIKSFAVGGTPSILLPYTLLQQDIASYDTVILETSVNDLWLIGKGAISQKRVAGYYSDTLRFLNQRGILPVILILPVDADLPGITVLRQTLSRIAAAQNAVLVDGYSVMEAVTTIAPCPRDELFVDASHIGSSLAEIIACTLQQALQTGMTGRKTRADPERRSDRLPDYPYGFASDFGHYSQRIEKKSSMLQKTYTRLTQDQSATFAFDSRSEVIGFAVNVTGCSAIVEATIDGVEKRYFDFRFSGVAENQALAFYHSLSPNSQPFTARHLSLRICRPDEVPSDLIVLSHAKNSRLNTAVLELEGVLLHKGTESDLIARTGIVAGALDVALQSVTLSAPERLMALKIAASSPDKATQHAMKLLRQMFPAGRDYAADRRPDLLRDIGSLLLAAGERAAAIQALTVAHKERPDGVVIKRLLDQAQNAEPDRIPPRIA